jgi:hypothetical protein
MSSGWRLEDRIVQRFALATFYYSTNGDTWSDGAIDGWLDKEEHECKWNSNQIGCLQGSEVDALDLLDRNLSGRLPIELGLLTELTALYLWYKELTGSIPFHPSSVA